MTTTYKEWKKSLTTTKDYNYYENLITYAPQIIEQLGTHKQYIVAKELNMPAAKLSIITPLLRSISNTKES